MDLHSEKPIALEMRQADYPFESGYSITRKVYMHHGRLYARFDNRWCFVFKDRNGKYWVNQDVGKTNYNH